jgi:hypothetical protein
VICKLQQVLAHAGVWQHSLFCTIVKQDSTPNKSTLCLQYSSVGERVGNEPVGDLVGEVDGDEIDGDMVGISVGLDVGVLVDGAFVGENEGSAVVGDSVGNLVGVE